ncbi:MAG TPA: Wzz/FepE/Etk N-terminal domain-containing protein [Steroidobacteraceae bacterium]|jgi:uncharacterized protein involved in exopolysaccharide biosynthesis
MSEEMQGNAVQTSNAGITVLDFLEFVRLRRWLIVIFTLAGAIGAYAAAKLIPSEYEATVLLSPVASQTSGSLGELGSAVSQLSGFASLAGVGLGAAGGPKAEAIATLQSESLTEQYIRDANLLPVLFSSKWDPIRKTWKVDKPTAIPTPWIGNQFFAHQVRKVTENSKTGLVDMTITWKDPRLAAQWANDLAKLTNNYLRKKAIDEAQRNIDYLNEQAEKATTVELQKAIYSLLESEIKNEMVARGNDEYALKIIDPAIAPERKSYPKTLLWTLGGAITGLLLGLLVGAARHALQRTAAGD